VELVVIAPEGKIARIFVISNSDPKELKNQASGLIPEDPVFFDFLQ
jgi:hypothetical protein